MKESLLTLGLTFLSFTGSAQTVQKLENDVHNFECIHGIQEAYEKLSKYSSEIQPQDVKTACKMAAYSHALEYMGTNEDVRNAIYCLDSLVQTHKISQQYIASLLEANTLEMAKSKYMVAESQLKSAQLQEIATLKQKANSLNAEYRAIADIQSGAEHVHKLYPQFNKERIAKYLQGAYYMKDVFENWQLHKANGDAEKYFDFLKMDIQGYSYTALGYADDVLNKKLPEKLAQQFYDGTKSLIDKISNEEYDKIYEYDQNLINPEFLKNQLRSDRFEYRAPAEEQIAQNENIVQKAPNQITPKTAKMINAKPNNKPINANKSRFERRKAMGRR